MTLPLRNNLLGSKRKVNNILFFIYTTGPLGFRLVVKQFATANSG